MAKRVGLDGPILKEITMHVPAQFVALRWQACCGSMGAVDSTFKDDDIDALGRQLASSQRRRESSANENDGAMFQACSHDFFPQAKSAIDFGSAAPGNCFPRKSIMSWE